MAKGKSCFTPRFGLVLHHIAVFGYGVEAIYPNMAIGVAHQRKSKIGRFGIKIKNQRQIARIAVDPGQAVAKPGPYFIIGAYEQGQYKLRLGLFKIGVVELVMFGAITVKTEYAIYRRPIDESGPVLRHIKSTHIKRQLRSIGIAVIKNNRLSTDTQR